MGHMFKAEGKWSLSKAHTWRCN